jgi:uncharacterized protein YbaR (Trm112 family)
VFTSAFFLDNKFSLRERAVNNETKYVRLLKKAVPVKIQTEEEYERLLQQIRLLMDRDEDFLSLEEVRLLDLLGMLVEQYEEEHYPIDEGVPSRNPEIPYGGARA